MNDMTRGLPAPLPAANLVPFDEAEKLGLGAHSCALAVRKLRRAAPAQPETPAVDRNALNGEFNYVLNASSWAECKARIVNSLAPAVNAAFAQRADKRHAQLEAPARPFPCAGCPTRHACMPDARPTEGEASPDKEFK